MNKTILALSAAALALTGTTAIAQHRGAHNPDTDGNGSVTLTEMQAASAERFARMDANGDGVINAADRQARGGRRRGLFGCGRLRYKRRFDGHRLSQYLLPLALARQRVECGAPPSLYERGLPQYAPDEDDTPNTHPACLIYPDHYQA